MGLAIAGILAGVGFTALVAGGGLVWAGRAKPELTATPIAARAGEQVAV
jgi:hypothetical protein